MKRRMWFSIVVAFLLMGSLAWANPPETVSANPAPDDDAVVSAESVPFDPFDDTRGDIFSSEGDLLQTVADPFSGFNRVMFTFNDKVYFWALKPMASGYRFVVPSPVRVSVKNFFFNLLMPVRLVNCLLQGKGRAAEGEFGRFVANTTVGVLGLFNPAKDHPHLNPPVEDFGQTLGHYSIGNGFYIIWPIFGPSTLRDTVGGIGDWALNPFSFMQLVNADAGALTSDTTNVIGYGVRTINDTSFRIGDYEALKNSALDPYESFRNVYIQNRDSKIAH